MLAIYGEVVATVATTFRSRMHVMGRDSSDYSNDSAFPVLWSALQGCTGGQPLLSPNAGQSGSFLTMWLARSVTASRHD